MNEKQSPYFLAGMVVLSAALVASAWLGAKALGNLRSSDQTVSVTGSARKSIRSDFAIWRSSVGVESATQQQAYAALQEHVKTIKNYFFQEKGIPAEALRLGAVQTSSLPELLPNGNDSGKIRGYRLSQSFEIQLADVKKIETLAQESGELIQRGLPFDSYPPEYLYTRLSDLRVEMLSEATKDARLRAEQILKSAGSHLGPVRAVRTGVFQITRPHSTEVSDSGLYDTGTIEKDITAVLTLSFAVD
ncbi:SIMPL domain-containing protein [bacterium (Candidatus Blackallbacteria) CG17_big_fil_post_rev_8_21_14_2_50_48_46]|uniref:SIMPL domain-containing protein n=1 Tax=bacterium (Candidatus Blackallbacteria) CG17_big_fil_post_rev_8_21_14_2_50_48_46 TaxID=2014261 RepID=A0A2M7FYT6_9BACT|nr:MAG: hypothetical protein COW64_14040 [bacterium (Candidatus Blackallbacteria) CG18_big_fil_WC_8_21_14_2_50_49_26]PIW14468.1 MAG: SIMPL domain-containing protein [bacterium (Candidatus Blackallbacteria) CG17_big_fil_post_rev_8_21_14_2_50_48_46]PIW47154.1 MAG: SIMPL domain-containing protein [bacterium (Candidatus Blackallbacteria) CG13_big_fil_rev_8_21_14_2_50_49_14]